MEKIEKDQLRNVKTVYEKPMIEVIEMEIEGAILDGSTPDFGDGGTW
ncbi:hypothetical protein ACGE0T_07975 [Parabacteroides sp. APC149_11_2_Y6]|mgnify:FL=1